MKSLLIYFALFLSFQNLFGQVSGNINYQKPVHLSKNNITVQLNANDNFIVSVKGLNNVKADAYVAIFSVSQLGKTAIEVTSLLNNRIKQVEQALSKKTGVEFYVDMLSFVPVYDFEVEKKIFSKTYNEVPKGFELKKNIHIKYKNPLFLNELISLCAKAEIYNLVKVDYFSENLEAEKKKLLTKSQLILKEKIQNYEEILGISLDSLNKTMVDGFEVIYPLESYQTYQAYDASSLDSKKYSKATTAKKSRTSFYQAITNKEFDLVINPVVVEPVIQLMYQVRLRVRQQNKKKENKKYILLSPTGQMKEIRLD